VHPRFVFSALARVLCLALIFATITTIRQISNRLDPGRSSTGLTSLRH
jgi:hypothetical protein